MHRLVLTTLAAVVLRLHWHGAARPVAQRANAAGQQMVPSVVPVPGVAQSDARSDVVPVPVVAQSDARPGVVPLVSMRAVVTFAADWRCYATTFLSSLPAAWARRAAVSGDADLPAYWQSSGASSVQSVAAGWRC